MTTLYPPFAALLKRANARVVSGTRSYDEQTTAFLDGDPMRAGCSPQNFGIGAVCEAPAALAGLSSDGPLISLDIASRGVTLPMVRAVFEQRRYDMALGLREVFAYLDRHAPWGRP